MKYTHDELVKKASKWLRSQKCVVIITEMASQFQEPDAIGWGHRCSILVECKASRSDFLKDKNKRHIRTGGGMGDYRYYLAPKGIIGISDLPLRWGLLEPCGGGLKIIKKAEYQREKSYTQEIGLLVSGFRRIRAQTKRAVGISVKYYGYETKNKATLGVLESREE